MRTVLDYFMLRGVHAGFDLVQDQVKDDRALFCPEKQRGGGDPPCVGACESVG